MSGARRPGSRAATIAAVVGAALAAPAHAHQQDDAVPAKRQTDEMHWASRLGLRAAQVDRAFPLIDRVVLVPDAATYVDELFKWSPRGRWPVLFEDDRFAPMFVARFAPAEVIRRPSVGGWPREAAARRRMLESIVIRTWGGDPAQDDPASVFQRQSYVPPGVVIASVDDPAWPAAVALASGRGEPLLWLEGSFGRTQDLLEPDRARALCDEIERLIAGTGYSYRALGDDVDAITLCRSVAGRADVALPPNARVTVGGDKGAPYATTDLIGRSADGTRFACTGWIFGDETRSTYVAMCSLFLPRTRLRLYDTYPDGGEWGVYGMERAAAELTENGFAVELTERVNATDLIWQRMLPAGLDCDVFVMNSKGNAGFFDMGSGRSYAVDVPVLHAPVAVHLVHSWSMRSPSSPATVAGRWIDHGAYAYVGSMHEPFLGAFVPPAALGRRWLGYIPFLVAARHYNGPFSHAWRVNTFGDPLMLCRPPGGPESRPRIATPAEYGADLRSGLADLLRQAQDDPSGRVFETAIRSLRLLGENEVAAKTWRVALQREAAAPSARVALPALFIAGDTDAFMQAWAMVDEPDALERDMLWHLHAPVRTTLDDPAALDALQQAIRPAQPEVDLERLAPLLARRYGREHVRLLVAGHLELARNRRVKRELQRLLDEYD